MAFFLIKVTFRDVRLIDEAYNNNYDMACVQKNFDDNAFIRMERESSLLFYIQSFLFLMGLDAVIRQYMPQIKLVAFMSILIALFGFTQIAETKIKTDQFNNKCGQSQPLDPSYFTNDVPNIIMTSSLVCFLVYLTFKMNKEFGGLIYKKIGTDKKMQKMFKTRLSFIMLYKANGFFILFLFVPTLALVISCIRNFDKYGKITLAFSVLHVIFSGVALRVLFLAGRSVKKENTVRLQQFIRTWGFVSIDWIILFAVCYMRGVIGPFFITFFGMREYVGQEMYNRKLQSFVPVIKVYDNEHIPSSLEKPAPVAIIDRSNDFNDTKEFKNQDSYIDNA
ncbi:1600_t:CDS:2 [Diversispora eburnea]|uniref:1600_t:CDS:1 n=1 Tax=Diversispora eburnea TaxID=1213867 RepID=A0A9N8YPN3_9GLOM|nr:1600_t:CDS:2 [Diversispora eburnea]